MKLKFVVKFVVKFGVGRTKGDIEALADARRALKNLKYCRNYLNCLQFPNSTKNNIHKNHVRKHSIFITLKLHNRNYVTDKKVESQQSPVSKW